MIKRKMHIKILVSAIFIIAANISFASFTGKTNEEHTNNKFSLKNLNNYSKSYYTLSPLKSKTFQFKNSQYLSQQKSGNGIEVQSMIRMQKGNTTYVYPYKYTVKMPLIKAPSVPPIR